jgi:hypothetical protein
MISSNKTSPNGLVLFFSKEENDWREKSMSEGSTFCSLMIWL